MGPPHRIDLVQPSHRASLVSEDLPSQIDILQAMMARQGRPIPGRQHQKQQLSSATRSVDLPDSTDVSFLSEEERSPGMIQESSSCRSSTSGETSAGHGCGDAHAPRHPPGNAGATSSGRGSTEGGSASEARDIDFDIPDYSLLFNEARADKTEGRPRVVPKYGEEMADVPTKRMEVYLPPPSPQHVPKRRSGCCMPFFGRS